MKRVNSGIVSTVETHSMSSQNHPVVLELSGRFDKSVGFTVKGVCQKIPTRFQKLPILYTVTYMYQQY